MVRDGRIEAVLSEGESTDHLRGARVELGDDEVLIPGLVDSHVHLNDPGRSDWEGFETGTRAAAAGGVTTVVDMPLNCIPPTTSPENLSIKRARARESCAVDIAFWGGAVPENLGHLTELADQGVVGFKCFLLASGVPEFAPLSAAELLAAATEIAAFDGLLIVHAEDADVVAAHHVGDTTHYADFLGSRPPAAETAAIDLVIEVAGKTGCRMHIVHLSSAEALPSIRAARRAGVRLTVETCPHYLTLAAESVADGQTQFKCCPPVREAGNADRLWQALKDREIDLVVSDHSPSPPELKNFETGEFMHAWGGIASLQLSLSLIWTEARSRGFALEEVLTWMARRPADLVGLRGKGRIEPGADADLVIFAPDAAWAIDGRQLEHRHPATPYDGRAVTGEVRRTYLRGVPIDLDEPARGQLIG